MEPSEYKTTDYMVHKITCEMCKAHAVNVFIGRTDTNKYWVHACEDCTDKLIEHAERG